MKGYFSIRTMFIVGKNFVMNGHNKRVLFGWTIWMNLRSILFHFILPQISRNCLNGYIKYLIILFHNINKKQSIILFDNFLCLIQANVQCLNIWSRLQLSNLQEIVSLQFMNIILLCYSIWKSTTSLYFYRLKMTLFNP